MKRIHRRSFLGMTGLAAPALATAAWPLALEQRPEQRRTIERELRRAIVPSLKPPWRLPVSWYRATLTRLQTMLRAQKLRGVLCTSGLNQNYLVGYFLTQTERPMWLWVPAEGEPAFFCPGLDRDLVASWWTKDFEWYFDFLHTNGFNQVVFNAGPETDLWKWVCDALRKRGVRSGRVALDLEPAPSLSAKLKKHLSKVKWVNFADPLLHLRQIKTPEEIALTQKAIDLLDAMLEFGRAYVLEYGTSATDYEVRAATADFGVRKLMESLGPELDGRPHTGVGIEIYFGCRTGRATAYPHPNQFFYKQIERGDAIQIAGFIKIGGYGGEGYRACHIEPVPELGRRMWDTHTAMTLKQAELSRAGVRSNQVAEGVLKIARDAGMEKFIYHRPAHGEGMEGHQAPYISPGDNTALEENMTFSNEPGLYNPDAGIGYNHSNNLRVTREGGEVMNKTPMTRAWCWLRL
jgi:Xaa-Pro aminopeptidase